MCNTWCALSDGEKDERSLLEGGLFSPFFHANRFDRCLLSDRTRYNSIVVCPRLLIAAMFVERFGRRNRQIRSTLFRPYGSNADTKSCVRVYHDPVKTIRTACNDKQ